MISVGDAFAPLRSALALDQVQASLGIAVEQLVLDGARVVFERQLNAPRAVSPDVNYSGRIVAGESLRERPALGVFKS